MLAYAVRRTLGAVVTLVLASLLVFSALLAVPGDPAQVILGLNASPEALEALRLRLGLDVPAPQRYLRWIGGVARGDFGESLTYQRPVGALLVSRLGVSVPLALGAATLACLVAVPLGILAARRSGTWLDPAVTVLAQLGAAVPSFWLGLLLILLFAVRLGWLPAGGFVPWERDPLGAARSLLLPTLALALGQAAVMARMTRAALLDVLRLDYVRTARAKGLSEKVVNQKHARRNAMIPVITLSGFVLIGLINGVVITETIFDFPGLGQWAAAAAVNLDYGSVLGFAVFTAILVVFANLLVDVLYGIVDPRIRYN